KHGDEVGIFGEVRADLFDDDELVEVRHPRHEGEVDAGHPALAELADEAVFADASRVRLGRHAPFSSLPRADRERERQPAEPRGASSGILAAAQGWQSRADERFLPPRDRLALDAIASRDARG